MNRYHFVALMMLSQTMHVAAMVLPRTRINSLLGSNVAAMSKTVSSRSQFHSISRIGTLSRKSPIFYANPSSSPSSSSPSSSSSSSSFSDKSAATQSRQPFRMPRNSPDDSKTRQTKTSTSNNSNHNNEITWAPLGLWTQLVDTLQQDLHLSAPTPIQSMVIPELLSATAADRKANSESLAFLAATGSGKTLAYLLPLVQQLKHEEMFENFERRPRRPRVLILAPTRELVQQITTVCKSISHAIKISSQALVGGGKELGAQRKALSREVDVVVATPGRLLQHWKQGNVFLGSVHSIVLDEMDTMLEQGFQRELREILYPLLYSEGSSTTKDNNLEMNLREDAPRIILTSATMTQAVQKLIGDNPKTSKLSINAKKAFVKQTGGEETNGKMNAPSKLQLPKMKILYAPGLHKAVPRLEQIFVDVGSTDKISLLLDVVASESGRKNQHAKRKGATIIFCNTSASCRAVQFALAEAQIESLSYHGELSSADRSENLKQFRRAASGLDDAKGNEAPTVLVCTDLAARGLDIPEVDHVVMFDFPLNALDYLHRSGRTARGEGRGKVTALVAKRDKVLATAIEQAVRRGKPLDGLSSRKSDYGPGAQFGAIPKKQSQQRKRRQAGPGVKSQSGRYKLKSKK